MQTLDGEFVGVECVSSMLLTPRLRTVAAET